MRNIVQVAATIAAIVVPGAASAQCTASARVDTATIRRTLIKADSAFSAAYVSGNAAAIKAMYTPDAMLIPTARIVRGRDDIERWFTPSPASKRLAHSLTLEALTIEGCTAIEVGTWSSTSQSGGNPAVTNGGRYLLVWLKQRDGSWMIRHDMWHSPPASR